MSREYKNQNTLKILYLEDDPRDAELITELISSSGISAAITLADAKEVFENILRSSEFDIILSDFKLPGFDAFGALKLRNEICPLAPFICVSGSIGEETAIELLKQGAVDYVLKDRPDRLPFAIQRALDDCQEKRARLRTEILLKESEEKYRTIFENVQDVFFQTDLEGTIREISPSIKYYSDFSRDELINKHVSVLYYDPADRGLLLGAIFKNKEIRDYELRIKTKNGLVKYTSINARLIFNPEGKPGHIDGAIRDITERKRNEQLILENNLRLSRLLKIYEFDSSGIQEFLDYSLKEALVLTASKFGVLFIYNEAENDLVFKCAAYSDSEDRIKNDPNKISDAVKSCLLGESISEHRLVIINDVKKHLTDGNKSCAYSAIFKNLLSVPVMETDKFAAVVCVANKDTDYDETDAKQLNLLINSVWRIVKRKEAEEKARMLSRAVEQSPVSIMITDPEGIIEYVNPKFLEKTDFTLEEIIGSNPRVFSSGKHSREFYQNLWDTVLSGRDWKDEILNKKKNGELFWEEASISPVVNSNGDITHLVAIAEDITDKKRRLDELIKAKEYAEEMNRLKTNFMANMSHELRTPLVGVLGISELMLEDNSGEQKENIQIIYESSKRLLLTLKRILDYSKFESASVKVKYEKVNICEIVATEINYFRNSAAVKQIELIADLPREDCIFNTDKTIFGDLLNNLLDNAVKFTNRGSVTVSVEKKKAGLQLTVSDTGIGIDEHNISLIFQEFRQVSEGIGRDYEGTGLGLTIVKKYVTLLNGTIDVKSAAGEGTSFEITLPERQ